MLQFLQRPLSLPFVLTIFLFFTWISLHFHTASKASSSSLHWTAIHHINLNLLRFRSGIPSKILKDECGWLLDPLSLAYASRISGGAITCVMQEKSDQKSYGEVTIGSDDIIVAASPSGTTHVIKNVDQIRCTFFLGCQDNLY
ncbi:hypothetical protein HN51_060430 [Arachis hypogaea]